MRPIAIDEHGLSVDLREEWARADEPHDPVSAAADGGESGKRLADLGEGRLAPMDEQSIDVRVLSLTTPGLPDLSPSSSVTMAPRVNDLIAEPTSRRPPRPWGDA